ncbi:MAG: hypothetical protein Q4F52_06950 [Bacteroidaceae bacterium]|nr:hypothetical protein [Bacteroidaceae bacterium]
MNALEFILDNVVQALIPLGICVVLPIMSIWLVMRNKTNETNKRTEVLLAAIEKNPDLDMEDFIRKMNPKTKTTKERLMSRLLWGLVFIAIGTSTLLSALYQDYQGGAGLDYFPIYSVGGCLLLIGISFVAVFFISKRMLAKEIEAEEEKALEK